MGIFSNLNRLLIDLIILLIKIILAIVPVGYGKARGLKAELAMDKSPIEEINILLPIVLRGSYTEEQFHLCYECCINAIIDGV